jgi:hypothetical protein
MADLRIIDIGTTTTSSASDDYLALDGVTNGTRKILASDIKPNKAMGALYMATPAATTPGDSTNYFKVAGTTALNSTESVVMNLDMPANNRLRYTGTGTVHAHVAVTIAFSAGSNNQDCFFRVYKYDASGASGATLVHSQVENKIATGADTQSTALHCDCLLDTNDYLELHVQNSTSTATVTVKDLYMFILGVKYM